jgi:hypothetical protein
MLKGAMAEHPGDCPTYVHLIRPERSETIIELELKIRPSEEMLEAVERLFGTGVAYFQ